MIFFVYLKLSPPIKIHPATIVSCHTIFCFLVSSFALCKNTKKSNKNDTNCMDIFILKSNQRKIHKDLRWTQKTNRNIQWIFIVFASLCGLCAKCDRKHISKIKSDPMWHVFCYLCLAIVVWTTQCNAFAHICALF